MMEGYRNILIIKPSSLGDIVQALPALSALRRNFPEAKISWLVRNEFAPLLRGHPHLDKVILFDRRLLGKAWVSLRAFAALLSFVRNLQRSKFDLVIDLQGLFRTAFLGRLSGCRKRFGMADARELAHIFYTHKISPDAGSPHVVDYYLKIVKAASHPSSLVPHPLSFIVPEDSAAADSVRRLLTVNDVNRYAVFVPGSAHKDKRWPAEYFAALVDKISQHFDLSVVAVGTASEKNIVEQIKGLTRVSVVNLAGVTSISELTALLRAARLVVSNDTGPGHIAAALGVPMVMIFGRSNPARVAPYGRNNCVAAVEPWNRGFKANNPDPKYNVKFVTVDEVYQKVCEQLDK